MNQHSNTKTSKAERNSLTAYPLSKTYPAYIVLIIGLLASLGIWYLVNQKVETDHRKGFEKAINSAMTRIENGYKEHEHVLRSVDGLYDGYIQVVRDVFELYASIPTKTYPSILSIDFVPSVSAANKGEFVFYAQSERYYDYAIHPPGDRPKYYPIEYIVPFEKNEHRSGYDLGTEAVVSKMLQQTNDKKGYRASPFFNVRPDTLGFMLMTSVFKKSQSSLGQSLDGVVLLEVDANLFFKNALGHSTTSDTTIAFQVFAPTGAKEEIQQVYSSGNLSFLKDGSSPYREVRSFDIGGRKISVNFYPASHLESGFQSALPLISLIGSILISIGLFGFVLSTATSRAHALDLAERITRSQRRIVDSSTDMIGVMDMHGSFKTMNPASMAMLGYSADELIGRNVTDFFKNTHDKDLFKKSIESAEDEVSTNFDVEMLTKSGDSRWISWNLTVSNTDGSIYGVGRDVTLQKLAEEQIKLKNNQVELALQYELESGNVKSGFMKQLARQISSALTGIIEQLQLLAQQSFKTKEEEEESIGIAQQSAEELYYIVTDMLERAEYDSKQGNINLQQVNIVKSLENIRQDFVSEDIALEVTTPADKVNVIANTDLIDSAISNFVTALAHGSDDASVKIYITPNEVYHMTELQILGPANTQIGELIELLKGDKEKVIDTVATDRDSILFRLALGASLIRRMSGTITFDSLGEEGNAIIIQLPLKENKTAGLKV